MFPVQCRGMFPVQCRGMLPTSMMHIPLGGWSVVFPRFSHRSAHGLHCPLWEDRSKDVVTGLHRKTCEDRGRPCASCWEDPLTSLQLRHCVHCHAKRANSHWQSTILSKLCLASWASATPSLECTPTKCAQRRTAQGGRHCPQRV